MQKLFGGDLKPDFPASLRGFSSSPCSPDSCLGRGNAKRPLEARGVSESPREAAGQISQSLLEPTPPEGSRQRPQAVKGEGHAWHGAAQGTALDTGGLDKKLADAVPAPPAPAVHCWAHPHFRAGGKRVSKEGSRAAERGPRH